MKRKALVALIASIMVLSLAACGKKETTNDYKLGMGIVVADSSKEGTAQVDATIAIVVTDANGKIVACKLDVAQTKMTTADGVIQAASEVDLRSKLEKGDDYNMKKFGNSIAEWYEQANFFAKQVVGLTGAEVEALATQTKDDGHVVSTDSAILAGCTMSIAEFKEAIGKACKDSYAKSFKAKEGSFKLGLSVITSVDDSSASATAEADGKANMYTDFAAVVVDNDGKIIVDLLDAIQPKITFNTSGAPTGFNFSGSKKELKEKYNMVQFGGSISEWYTQATDFENYIVGKDSASVSGIDTNGANADLLASVTIHIDGFQASIVKAIKNAE